MTTPSTNPEDYQTVRLIPARVAEVLARLRHLTPEFLGACLGMPGPAVEQVLAGQPTTMATARKIASQLNVGVQAVVDPASMTAPAAPPFAPPTAQVALPTTSATMSLAEPPVVDVPVVQPAPRRGHNPLLYDANLDAAAREAGLSLAEALALAELAAIVAAGTDIGIAGTGRKFYESLVPAARLVVDAARAVGKPLDQAFNG